MLNETSIKIVKGAMKKPNSSDRVKIVSVDELRDWIKQGVLLKHLFRYDDARILTYRNEVLTKPLLTALILRLFSRKKCFFEDEQGSCREITLPVLVRILKQLINDFVKKSRLLNRVRREVSSLTDEIGALSFVKDLDLEVSPVYLRTDLWFGVRSGGSVGHIAGVLNNLSRFTGEPVF